MPIGYANRSGRCKMHRFTTKRKDGVMYNDMRYNRKIYNEKQYNHRLPMAIPACHLPQRRSTRRYIGIGKTRTKQTGRRATMAMVEKRVIRGLMSRKYDRAEYE